MQLITVQAVLRPAAGLPLALLRRAPLLLPPPGGERDLARQTQQYIIIDQ